MSTTSAEREQLKHLRRRFNALENKLLNDSTGDDLKDCSNTLAVLRVDVNQLEDRIDKIEDRLTSLEDDRFDQQQEQYKQRAAKWKQAWTQAGEVLALRSGTAPVAAVRPNDEAPN